MLELTRQGWGKENDAFMQVWSSTFQPGGTLDYLRSWAEQMRLATTAEKAVRLLEIGWSADVREAARKLKCPVLAVHAERDRAVPIAEGRLLASLIPHCRFVQLDSQNHMPLPDEPEWPQLIAEIQSFLAKPNARDIDASRTCRSTSLLRVNALFLKPSPTGSITARSPPLLDCRRKRFAIISPGYSTRFRSSTAIRRLCARATRDLEPGRAPAEVGTIVPSFREISLSGRDLRPTTKEVSILILRARAQAAPRQQVERIDAQIRNRA